MRRRLLIATLVLFAGVLAFPIAGVAVADDHDTDEEDESDGNETELDIDPDRVDGNFSVEDLRGMDVDLGNYDDFEDLPRDVRAEIPVGMEQRVDDFLGNHTGDLEDVIEDYESGLPEEYTDNGSAFGPDENPLEMDSPIDTGRDGVTNQSGVMNRTDGPDAGVPESDAGPEDFDYETVPFGDRSVNDSGNTGEDIARYGASHVHPLGNVFSPSPNMPESMQNGLMPWEDVDEDGRQEHWHTDDDGKPDMFDTDGDEKPDAKDTTGNGKPDEFYEDDDNSRPTYFDTNGDGKRDAKDTDGDGLPDLFNTDGDNYYEKKDTTGNGKPDSDYEGDPDKSDPNNGDPENSDPEESDPEDTEGEQDDSGGTCGYNGGTCGGDDDSDDDSNDDSSDDSSDDSDDSSDDSSDDEKPESSSDGTTMPQGPSGPGSCGPTKQCTDTRTVNLGIDSDDGTDEDCKSMMPGGPGGACGPGNDVNMGVDSGDETDEDCKSMMPSGPGGTCGDMESLPSGSGPDGRAELCKRVMGGGACGGGNPGKYANAGDLMDPSMETRTSVEHTTVAGYMQAMLQDTTDQTDPDRSPGR